MLILTLLLGAATTASPLPIAVSARAVSPHSVEVSLVGPGGHAVSGARVSILPVQPGIWGTPGCVAATAPDGIVRFSGVPESSLHALITSSPPLVGGFYLLARPNDRDAGSKSYPVGLEALRSYCAVGEPVGLREPPTPQAVPTGFTTCSFPVQPSKVSKQSVRP